MRAKKILIVDDKSENRYLLRSLLEGHGYTVEEASQGKEALELARKNPPELIISDILMPVQDGFSLCREWKTDARLSNIPFIFYTATYTDIRDRDFALSLGAERFIIKPEEPDSFMATIIDVLQHVDKRPDGKNSPPTATPPDSVPVAIKKEEDHVYLKQYNEALIRKLEAKMEQLELTNRRLEQDIAKREQLEDKHYDTEQRLRTVVNTIPDMVWLKDPEGVYLFCNHRFERFFGAKESEIIGRSDYDFFSREEADSFRAHDRKAMEEGGPSINEEWVTFREDGHRELLETIKTPMLDSKGKLIGVLGISRDITAHKRSETELQAQLEELRRWHTAMLGRESRILELKREVNELRTKGGLPIKYESAEGPENVPTAVDQLS